MSVVFSCFEFAGIRVALVVGSACVGAGRNLSTILSVVFFCFYFSGGGVASQTWSGVEKWGVLYSLPTDMACALLFARGVGVCSTLCPRKRRVLYSLPTEVEIRAGIKETEK